MLYKHTVIAASLVGFGIIGGGFVPKTFSISAAALATEPASQLFPIEVAVYDGPEIIQAHEESTASSNARSVKKKVVTEADVKPKNNNKNLVYTVPFFSQLTDISATKWKKVGCGVASLAMLIDFYKPKTVTVDELLERGIASGAYANDVGWSHAGLIALSQKYGLKGESHDLRGSSMEDAFAALKSELKTGPVMASVHYTFTPTNPIPHIVVVSGVSDGKVYYNDPAEKAGEGSISIAKFQSAWKKRYIDIRPV